jgi:dTDP-4-dehydrorhamnose reductase
VDRRVLILGAAGQLGQALRAQWPAEDLLVPIYHSDCDIADPAQVGDLLRLLEPQLVVNCTAYHKVDEMEAQAERGFAVNALGPFYLAQGCAGRQIPLVHFSTDYVFGGNLSRFHPYRETDRTDPLNVYGASKAAGEQLVRLATPNHLIIRSTGLYGPPNRQGNFVRTMLRLAATGQTLKVVDDQLLTPTSCAALASQTMALLGAGAQGTFHATCQGACSWFEFAHAIFRLRGQKVDLRPQSSAELGARARRPAHSVLDNAHLGELGLDRMPDWQVALAAYLAEI